MRAILILTKVKKKSVELLEKVQKSKIVSRKQKKKTTSKNALVTAIMKNSKV